jgi:hypothetical protein
MKPGIKLKSAVCDTEVVVIRWGGQGTLECGGPPMIAERPSTPGKIDGAFSGGTVMGKRYVDATQTFEVLCIKPGKGSLSLDGTPLAVKDAKPLPSSD